MVVEGEASEEVQKKIIQIKSIDLNKVSQHIVYLKQEHHTTFSNLWELQRKHTFQGDIPNTNELFRIKSLSTGLYLSQDRLTDLLVLTSNGDLDECYFLVNPKRLNNGTREIQLSELFHFKTFNGSSIQSNERAEGYQHNDRNLACIQNPIDTTRIFFSFQLTDDKFAFIADRIAMLFPYFVHFHEFVQNWGIETIKNSQFEEVLTYRYSLALQAERDLEFEVEQFEKSLENLSDFLTANNKDLSLDDRRNLVMEQNIVEILLLIAELLDAKIYGNKNKPESSGKLIKLKRSTVVNEWIGHEKSPEMIAYRHLFAVLKKIYQVLFQCIHHHSAGSEIILKYDSFLSGQLLSYQKEVGSILKESIANSIDLSDNDPHGERV